MSDDHKPLGFIEGLATSIGLVLAASTILTVSQGFGMAGDVFVIALLIAYFLMMCQATSFSELAGLMPTAGAVYDYVTAGMGRFAGMTVTIAAYIVVTMFAGTAEAAAAGVFALANLGVFSNMPMESAWIISWAIILMTVAINLVGVGIYGKAETVMSAIKWLTLLTIGLFGVLMSPRVELDGFFGASQIGSNWEAILSMVGFAMFLLVGAEYVTPLAAEMRNPGRNIPRSLYLGLTMVLLALLCYGTGIQRQVANVVIDAEAGTQLFETPASIPAFGSAVLGNFGKWWLALAVFVASVATLNTIVASIPRILYGMAKDGMLPKIFAYLHPRFKTPWVGIFFVAAIPAIGAFLIKGNIDRIFVMILAAICSWIFSYAMINLSLILLRRRRPDLHRPYRVPFYPLPQILATAGLLITFWHVAPPFLNRSDIYLPFGIVLVICAAFSLIWTTRVQKINAWKPVDPEELMQHERG